MEGPNWPVPATGCRLFCRGQFAMSTALNRPVRINPQSEPSFSVVRLSRAEYGSLNAAHLAAVRQLLLTEAETTTAPCLVIDLSAVHVFGASLVGILVSSWEVLRKRNRRLILCGLTPFCARLVQTLYLDRLFEIVPNQRAVWEGARCDSCGGNRAAHGPGIRIQKSDVAWAPGLMRVDFI